MTQLPTPVVTVQPVAAPAPVPVVASPAPALTSGQQFLASRLITVVASIAGGWMVAKGFITKDQATSYTTVISQHAGDILVGLLVGLGGNTATAKWSTWYRKLLELKPATGIPTTPGQATDEMLRALLTAIERLAEQKTAGGAGATPMPAAPTQVKLSAGAVDAVADKVLQTLDTRLTAIEQALSQR